MSVSAVNSNTAVQTYSNDYAASKPAEKTESGKTEAGAVYEASKGEEKKATYSVNKMSKEERSALVSKLQADAENRQSQLVSMVQKMMSQQANAYGQANDIWKFLASGKAKVDPATRAQAQADIAEDGYYGVKQTASRLFDFASALAGDDVEKMKEMQAAIEKGFKKAEKTWGGKLPGISYDTKEAVNKMFDDYYSAMGVEA
ncbi:MAG: hypothetical protein K1W13_06040 [Lachnospiraceae bacterium]